MPVVPTIVVGLAIATMIALGLWQLLDRLPAKQAYLAQLARNPARPPIAFPRAPDDSQLFRRASALCRPPVAVARAGAGNAGYRLIATCAADAAGPAFRVQMGTTHDPVGVVAWDGGAVSGWVSHAPDARPLIATIVDRRPQELLLVSDRPLAPGLRPNVQPDIGLVPNNHLAYGVQWFLFAGVAAVIYAVALRRRG